MAEDISFCRIRISLEGWCYLCNSKACHIKSAVTIFFSRIAIYVFFLWLMFYVCFDDVCTTLGLWEDLGYGNKLILQNFGSYGFIYDQKMRPISISATLVLFYSLCW